MKGAPRARRRRPPSPRSQPCWSGCALRTAYGHARPHWNVTGNVRELFLVFFSPGTGTISAVTWKDPFGGAEDSVTWQLVDSPAVVWGTIVWPLTLEPEIVTLHLTLFSVFWPVFAKFNVKVGAGLAGIEFVEPVWSWLPPTLTVLITCPCRPGAMFWEVVDEEGSVTWSTDATWVGSSHWIEGRNWLELSCWPPRPPTVMPAARKAPTICGTV